MFADTVGKVTSDTPSDANPAVEAADARLRPSGIATTLYRKPNQNALRASIVVFIAGTYAPNS